MIAPFDAIIFVFNHISAYNNQLYNIFEYKTLVIINKNTIFVADY